MGPKKIQFGCLRWLSVHLGCVHWLSAAIFAAKQHALYVNLRIWVLTINAMWVLRATKRKHRSRGSDSRQDGHHSQSIALSFTIPRDISLPCQPFAGNVLSMGDNHTQLKAKCISCDLHFVVCTWYPEQHSTKTLHCPECGQNNGKFITWSEAVAEPICFMVPGQASMTPDILKGIGTIPVENIHVSDDDPTT